jgi:hypothetical protein
VRTQGSSRLRSVGGSVGSIDQAGWKPRKAWGFDHSQADAASAASAKPNINVGFRGPSELGYRRRHRVPPAARIAGKGSALNLSLYNFAGYPGGVPPAGVVWDPIGAGGSPSSRSSIARA